MKKWLLFLILIAPSLFAAPNVVVSIKPIHDVALAVMDGVAIPTLLVPSGASPHSYSLSPSQAKALYQADVIIWVGPALETFLSQPLKQRKSTAILMTVLDIPNMRLYPYRSNDDHDHGPIDPHLWLDPINLMNYAAVLAKTLSTLDPDHAAIYTANKEKVIAHLKQVDQGLFNRLIPFKNTSILVFHDAYQYFERRYHLKIVGTVVLRPDVLPSVSRILHIQQRLKSEQVRCIFSEPQFKPAIVERLVADTDIGYGVLDPLGQATPTGLAGTEALFKNLADNIINCKGESTAVPGGIRP